MLGNTIKRETQTLRVLSVQPTERDKVMARDHHLPPSAACLSASMRDLGYSLETAVADLIDNSISANATEISIICDLAGMSPTLSIVDNGWGMSANEIVEAMRHGTANPRQKRMPRDLGRFGLGLKTASFSQCRSLTVASAKESTLNGATWSLDKIDALDDWILSILDEAEVSRLPHINRLSTHGTVVVWSDLDRLFEDEIGRRRDEIVNEKLDILEKHLSLVFHRYLSGEIKGRKRISISINGHAIQPFDPFCRKNAATQFLPEEVIYVGGAAVKMQPYILPHHSRLSAREYEFYQSRSDFISNQGAYIYRNGRLMAWGDWFRLVPKGEATKLARVQIDFPNSLDESWTIDIKKSRARPPHPVRDRLRQVIAQITGRSTIVHRGRGQKLFEETAAPMWERYADQGRIRYVINSTHPVLQALEGRLDLEGKQHLALLIDMIATSLPVEMVYSDYSTRPREVNQLSTNDSSVTLRLHALKKVIAGNTLGDARVFREILKSTRLFENHMDIAEQFIREEFA